VKFNNIFGNPPFQNNITKNKTQHKIWIDFTLKAFNDWLEENGHIGWITPQSWGSPSNKVLDLFKKSDLIYLNLDTKKYFPDIGSTFSHFFMKKSKNNIKTDIVSFNKNYQIDIDDSISWISNDFCDISYQIHKKVMFSDIPKFKINYDYVTCHNVIRRAEILKQKKLHKYEERILNCVDEEKKKNLLFQKNKLLKKKINISLSEVKTDIHIFPVFHTNNKIWYSSKQQDFSNKKKVMWSRSGYFKAFYDSGNLGCTDMGYYILVDSDEEGINLKNFLNCRLMQYIFKTAKWSGFGNEIVYSSIPLFPLNKKYNDKDIFKYFNLTNEEIDYLNKDKKQIKNKNKSKTISQQRIKEYGEVYTPLILVNEILELLDTKNWIDKSQTFLDPSCGDGNFLVGIFNKRLKNNISVKDILLTTYGIDILQDNVMKTIERLKKLSIDADPSLKESEILYILKNNIKCCDSLECDFDKIFSVSDK